MAFTSTLPSLTYIDSDDINTNLLCCICQAPFTEPVTTLTCTHTFCRACIVHALSISPHCPVDRSELAATDLAPASHIIRNLVDELAVECPHHQAGCGERPQRALLTSHLKNSCGYVRVPCPRGKCDSLLLRRDADAHDCERAAVCKDCGQDLDAGHSSLCGSTIIECEACKSPFPRRSMAAHTAECASVTVTCPHVSYGCSWTGPRAELGDAHMMTCAYEAIKGFFLVHKARLAEVNDENARLRHRVDSLEGMISVLQRESYATRAALGPWYRPTQQSASGGTSTQTGTTTRVTSTLDGYPFPEQAQSVSLPPTADAGIDQLFASLSPAIGIGDVPEPISPANATHGHPTPSHPLPFAVHATAPSAPVAPLDLSTTLEGALSGLRGSVVALSATVDSVGRHAAIAQAADAARTAEELGALRAVVNGLRMQVHSLMMHRNAQVTGRLGEEHGQQHTEMDEVGWPQFGMPPPPHMPLSSPFPLAPRYFGPPPGPRSTKL